MGNGPCYTTVKTLYCYISVQHTVNYATGKISNKTSKLCCTVYAPSDIKISTFTGNQKPR